MAETLREYLVSLGWKIDEASWKKYEGALLRTAETTLKVGSVAAETAVAIELMVAKVARQYETLYYVSQRTGQSATYIQSAQFAFKQMGLSADDATSAIEGVATAMRLNPGLRALFGGATKPDEIARNLNKSGLPYFVQARLAGLAGISEKTFQHFTLFGAQEEKAAADHARRMNAAGIDTDKASERFAQFGRTLNTLEDDFSILATRVALDWVDPVEKGVKAVSDAVEWITRADKATQGWALTLASFGTTALAGWLGNKLLGSVLRALGVLGPAGGGAGAAGAGGAASAAAGGVGGLALRALLGPAGALLGMTVAANADEGDRKWNQPLGAPGGGTPTDRLNQAVKFFVDQGYPRDAAIGIASSLFFESGKTLSPTASNPAGGGRGALGIGQWRGARLDAFRDKMGKDVSQASYEEQLQFVAWELSQGQDFGARRAGQMLHTPGLGAGEAAGMFLGGYERPGPAGAGEVRDASEFADRLSALVPQQSGGDDRSVHVSQKTDIHVSGAGASDTAGIVLDKQDSVNDRLVRNLAGNIR